MVGMGLTSKEVVWLVFFGVIGIVTIIGGSVWLAGWIATHVRVL